VWVHVYLCEFLFLTKINAGVGPQMQGVGGKSNKYAGMIDVMVKAVEREGLRGLYKVDVCLT
jgi:hypothetical protein